MTTKDPLRIGLLFSKTGVTSRQESSQLYGALFAIDEINGLGGVDGRELVAVHYDPQSDTARYKALLERLIIDDGIDVTFGGYTSSSRKVMLPVVEKYNKLLIYPEQYEGFEFSENIIYTGAAPNQNIAQLANFMTSHFGARIYMVGSRYVYPYETNRTMQSLMALRPDRAILGERYVSLHANRDAIDAVLADIQQQKPDFIFCTLIGNAVPYLYEAYHRAGLDPATMPIASLNTSEAEIDVMGAHAACGHFTSSPYFQSVDSALNRSTLERFFASRHGEFAVPNMNWEASYFAMHLLAKAYRNAESDQLRHIVPCMLGSEIEAPQGRVRIDPSNHHACLYPRIGQANGHGQFTIVQDALARVNPDPYMVHHDWGDEETHVTSEVA
ncbi:MAG: branched-chain amino acid transport system substrate-binding protein [Janthinobacterium sp.]|jgi:branched-chain amino acid transport system substrate-binding protein